MADYDAIVIGSGHNALVCALYLCRAGWRVLVLERHSDVGGATRTAELTLPGFTHDIAATNVNQFVASMAYRELGSDLRAAGLKIISSRSSYATAFKDGGAARVYTDRELTEREIARLAPDDLEKWREACSLFERTAPHVFPLFHEEAPSRAMVARAARFFAARPLDALRMAWIAQATLRDLADRWFRSEEMKGVLAPWAFHLDCGPDVRGGAAFAFLASMAGHRHGAHAAVGGTGTISTILRQLIENSGGHVWTNREVVRIHVRGNAASAIETSQGDVISAERAIIASVTPRLLFGKLVRPDDLSRGFVRRIGKFRYAPATFVVHLALSQRLDWRAGEDLADFAYVHVAATIEEIAKTYSAAIDGLLPARPMLVVSQPTSVDPSRAPAGRHIVRIHVRMVPGTIRGDSSGEISQSDWDDVKDAYADRILDILEEHAPNVKASLQARCVVSPLDLERDNPNLVGGDCGSGSHHLDQNYMFRPVFGWSRYATPIGKLYMVGASTWPGSGMNAASGYLAARRLLRLA